MDAKDSKIVQQPVAEPTCNWTGFYVGVYGGYGWGDSSFLELDDSNPPFEFSENGFFGGGQAGYNLQLGSFFVIGVEGEFAGSAIDDSAVLSIDTEEPATIENDWTGTVGARIGVTFLRSRLLLYAKGGVAFVHFNFHIQDNAEQPPEETFDADDTRTAPLVGGGWEYALTCHWSVKIEYKHLFLGDEDVTGVERRSGSPDQSITYHVAGDQDLIEAGVNFRF